MLGISPAAGPGAGAIDRPGHRPSMLRQPSAAAARPPQTALVDPPRVDWARRSDLRSSTERSDLHRAFRSVYFAPQVYDIGHWFARRQCSKCELYRGLHQPRSRRADHLAERAAGDIAIHRLRPEELRVVQGVESFQTELHGFGIRQG